MNIVGGIAVATTGSALSFSGFGFRPTSLKFTVGAKSGSAAVNQLSLGWVDSTSYQGASSNYSDSTGHESKFFNTKCLYVRERVAGTMTTVIEATFHSFTNDGFKLNVTTANSNYDVWVEASDI